MSDDRPAAARPERAGWFEDPEDPEQLRYFDGILWTRNTTPRRTIWTGSTPSAAAESPGAPATEHGASGGPYGYPSSPSGSPTSSREAPGHEPSRWSRTQAPTTGQTGPPGTPAYRPSHAAGPTTADGVPLASFGARFAAWMLDSVITWTAGLIVGGPLLWRGLGNYPDVVADALRTGATDASALAAQVQFDLPWIGAFAILQLVVGVVYHTVFLSRRGATPGKQVVGISVRLVDAPGVLSSADALRRSVLRPVLWLFTYTPVLSLFAMPLSVFDAVSALWDPQRQTLHDKIGRTVVVRGAQPRDGRTGVTP